jgi:hypothetical protein
MYVAKRLGMGQTCDAGYSFNASSGVCESDATFTAGSFCMASTFPFIGQTGDSTKNFACVPISTPIAIMTLGVIGVLLLEKGGRR